MGKTLKLAIQFAIDVTVLDLVHKGQKKVWAWLRRNR